MNQLLLIKGIKVQNANAVSGFTWGFPAITHFLGFTHNLSLKLAKHERFSDLSLDGCAVIAHQHQVHTYQASRDVEFLQSKNPPYLHGTSTGKLGDAPPIIEEGKMNMTVSLLIECKGEIGNRETSFVEWLTQACSRQRLAGGNIININEIKPLTINDKADLRHLTRKLLPGFILFDRAAYLAENLLYLQESDPTAEQIDAWLDFSLLKLQARPQSNLIQQHLISLIHEQPDDEVVSELFACWQSHLDAPFSVGSIPEQLISYFNALSDNKEHKKLLQQWQSYCQPKDKSAADWEYVKRKQAGYLVPIMTGYKAISKEIENQDVESTRDDKTRVCFVESVHSIGEWSSVHNIKETEQLYNSFWRYSYKPNWYLCKQGEVAEQQPLQAISADDEF